MTKTKLLQMLALEVPGIVILSFYIAGCWMLWGDLEIVSFFIAGSAFLNSIRNSIQIKAGSSD